MALPLPEATQLIVTEDLQTGTRRYWLDHRLGLQHREPVPVELTNAEYLRLLGQLSAVLPAYVHNELTWVDNLPVSTVTFTFVNPCSTHGGCN